MRRLAATGLSVAAGIAAAFAVAAAPAAAGLVRVHPSRLPLSLRLPSGWQVTGVAAGSRFDAAAVDGAAHLEVTTGAFPGTFQEFVATESALARRFYRSQDAHASVGTRTVSLGSGPALEVEVEVSLEQGGPLSITLFSILHGGVSYHFTYYTSQSLAVSERPQFMASASSIAFTGAPLTPAKTTPPPKTTPAKPAPKMPKVTPKPTPKPLVVSSSGAGLVRVHPSRLPLSLRLPSGWQVTGVAAGSRFDAAAVDGAAHLEVTTGAFPGTFQEFVATESALARRFYRSQDAHASVGTRTVSLGSGPALEVEVSLEQGGPLSITLFSILHGGVSYHFTYYTSQSLAASERPQFMASAGSIAFTG